MLEITTGTTVSLYQQIYEQLKNKIIAGELEEGTRLPSTRALAKILCCQEYGGKLLVPSFALRDMFQASQVPVITSRTCLMIHYVMICLHIRKNQRKSPC